MSIPGIEWTAGWRAFAELDEHEWIARVEPWVAALRAVDGDRRACRFCGAWFHKKGVTPHEAGCAKNA